MKVSDAQWNAALGLTRTATDKFSEAPAAAGYLAAVERVVMDAPGRPQNVSDDIDIAAYPDDQLVWIEAIGSHVTPTAARQAAYELLVLADLAEEAPDA